MWPADTRPCWSTWPGSLRLTSSRCRRVTFKQEEGFRERLAEMGLEEVHYSGRVDVARIRYGNIIASRWPLDAVELRYPKKELPWPQALARVSVTVNSRSIVVITAHIPNGATYGWEKIDTFNVLKSLVQRAKNMPCIVTGDFNEPQFEMQNGHIVAWGQEPDGRGGFGLWPAWADVSGRTCTGRDWDAAVRWVFEKSALQHAYWEAHRHGTMDVSHVSRGQKRWFDHIFVSDDFHVEQCDYLQQLVGRGCSDHSALSTSLTFDGQSTRGRPQQPLTNR